MVHVLRLWEWISLISSAISQSISIPPLSVSIILLALISRWRTPTVWASSCAKGQRISFVSITERRNITNKSITNTPDSFDRWMKGCQLPPDNIQYKAVVSVREEDAVMGGSPGCGDVWLCLSCVILHVQDITPYGTLRNIPYSPLHQPAICVSLGCELW